MNKHILLPALLIMAVLCTACNATTEQKLSAAEQELTVAEQKNERLEDELGLLWEENSTMERQLRDSEERNNDLKQQMIYLRAEQDGWGDSPEEFTRITADLQARPELIPFEGVLGGTPYFAKIKLLTSPTVASAWGGGFAFADAEDGHWWAELLYYFTLTEDGGIEWQLLASNMDGLTTYQ